jgi:phospholipid/cholesterol/gamma-HCH transport system substrate-binding protein
MRNHSREVIVGFVFFALLALLAFLTLDIGGEVLAETEAITFRFDKVSGLGVGAEVWINGLPSGTVKSVAFEEDGTVVATAGMRRPMKELRFPLGARVDIKSKSTLGGAVIAIEILRTRSKGDPEDLPTDLALLQSKVWTAQPGGLEALAQFTEPGTLGKSLVGEEGYENLNKALADLRKLTERLDRDEGLLGVLLSDKATADSFKKTIANLESVTDKAAHGQGLLPRLLEDKATADRFDRILADIESISSDLKNGKGTVGRLLKEEAVYEDLRAAVADIRKFADGLGDSKGLLPRLLRDEKMAGDFEVALAEVRGSFENLNAVAADIREGKGTLGKLVTDETLYYEVRDAARSLRRSFEEARENAPILTFAGFLFRTF